MGYDINTPLEGSAVDGGCEGVVHDEGNAMLVSYLGKFLKIKNGKCGVCDGLTEYRLGVGLECGFQLFLGAVGRDEGKIDTHLSHCHVEEIEGSAVYRRR